MSTRRPSQQRPEQRPHLSCLSPQWLAEAMQTERIEARATPSPAVPATTVAGSNHDDLTKRCQTSALTIRIRQNSGWLSPRRPSEQRPEQGSQLTCPPPTWLADPTPKKRKEASTALSPVVSATTVAELVHANKPNRGQISALTCCSSRHSRWVGLCRPSEEKPDQRTTKVVPATTVAL